MAPWAWRTHWQAQAAVRKAMKDDIQQESGAEEDPNNKYKNEHGDGSGDEGKPSRGRGRGRGRGRSRASKGKASGSKPEQKREQTEPSQKASIEVPKVDLASPPPAQTAAAKPVERDTSRENIDKFFAEHPGALPADHALAKSRPKAEHASAPPDTAAKATTAERTEAKQLEKDGQEEEREAKTPTKTPPRRSRRSRKSHTPKRQCETGTPKKTPKRANKRKRAKSEGSPAKTPQERKRATPKRRSTPKKKRSDTVNYKDPRDVWVLLFGCSGYQWPHNPRIL